MPVMGESGPIQIPTTTTSEQIIIGRDGSVSTPEGVVGALRRVTFADEHRLTRAGTTLFEAPTDMPAEDATTIVMQGTREQSNVSAVNEMVRMIVGTRHYEAAQKALTTMDEAIGQVTDPNS